MTRLNDYKEKERQRDEYKRTETKDKNQKKVKSCAV